MERKVDQLHRIESSVYKRTLHIWQSEAINKWVENVQLSRWCWENWLTLGKNVDMSITLFTKSELYGWIKNLTVRNYILKFLKETLQENNFVT